MSTNEQTYQSSLLDFNPVSTAPTYALLQLALRLVALSPLLLMNSKFGKKDQVFSYLIYFSMLKVYVGKFNQSIFLPV